VARAAEGAARLVTGCYRHCPAASGTHLGMLALVAGHARTPPGGQRLEMAFGLAAGDTTQATDPVHLGVHQGVDQLHQRPRHVGAARCEGVGVGAQVHDQAPGSRGRARR